MRTTALTSLAVCAALLLGGVACSGGDGGGKKGRDEPSGGKGSGSSAPSGTARPELPKASRFPVPKGFDNVHGWTEAVTEPDSRTHGSWALAPAAGVFVQVMNAEGKVHARTLDGGEEVWTFQAPTKLEGAKTDVYVASSGTDGDETAVIVRDGRTADDGLNRSRSLVTVDTVPMASTGRVKAAEHLEYEDGEAGPLTGGGLLVTRQGGAELLAVDPLAGKDKAVKQVGEVRLAKSGCREKDIPPSASCAADTNVEFTTSAGTVSSYSQDSYCDFRWKESDYLPCAEGFTVGRAWRSDQVAPEHAAQGTPLAVVGDYVVVDWSLFPGAKSEEAAKKDVVAVHDLADGKLVARVDCDITSARSGTGSVKPLAAQDTSQLSPKGDFLVSGQVGFDLSAKRGTCFADSEKRRGVTLTAVDDGGRAFGVTYTESSWADVTYGTFPHDFNAPQVSVPSRAVETDLRTGEAKPLPKNAALPVYVSADTGLFLTSGTLASYPVTGKQTP